MLREAHAHLAQHGRAMGMLQLADCRGLNDCLTRCRARAAAQEAPGWLLGVGLRVEAWPEARYPTLDELDSATGEAPACLWSFDHHALLLNSTAMRALAITGDTPDPAHGRILRDARGRPTGVMLERAAKQAWERVPEPGPAQWRTIVRDAARDLAGHGFTEVHDLMTQPWLPPILADLDRAGELPIRVRLFPLLPDLDALLATRGRWESERIALGGAKLFADGTLNSRTALMLAPYADPLPGLPRGQSMLSSGELCAALARTGGLGLTLAVHAIGDAAVRACLDAAEAVRAPMRIEHAEVIDGADVPRFKQLNVAASLQPCHLLTDIEVLRRSLPDRLERVLPIRDLIDSGLAPGRDLLFGSDTPIVRPHPADSVRAAVHRRREGMGEAEAIGMGQAITEAEAWAAFSAG